FSKLTGELRTRLGLPPTLRFAGEEWELWDEEELAIDLDAGIRGQYTRDILLPGEKLYFGGSRYGRGYYSGEITGDRGFIADLELGITRKNLLLSFDPIIRTDLTLYGFYNQGFAYDVDPDHPPRRRVESAGGGLRFDFERKLRMEVEYVRRAQRRPGGVGTDPLDRHAVYWRVGSQF
ncbi:ShlB/FhaC/HecB family hemolysin secretion/activation protein, partial [Azospirillum thermophilum]